MRIIKQKRVMKQCLSENGTVHWIRSDIRFIRKNDIVKLIKDNGSFGSEVKAICNPFAGKHGEIDINFEYNV